jgi:hypothetical protein
MFRQDFSCPALLYVCLVPPCYVCLRGYHPVSLDFPDHSAHNTAISYGLFRFRSPLLTESRLISFPLGT